MKRQFTSVLLMLAVGLALSAPAVCQESTKSKPEKSKPEMTSAAPAPAAADAPDTQAMPGKKMQVPSGQKAKMSGIIVRRDADSFVLRQKSGEEQVVKLIDATRVEERKSNPFRGAKKYAVTQLLRGLTVQVEGQGDSSGMLVAQKIKFTDEDLMVAETVESRVNPVEGRVSAAEGRVGQAETRLDQGEQNAQRLAGQVEELGTVANTAKGGAKAAQQTADAAVAGVSQTQERISALDDYEVGKTVAVNFRAGSARLSPESKAMLDEIASEAKNQKGFVIEVAGHASSEGGSELNRRLSAGRADAVVRYLAENHNIPLRRIILPFGYGAAQPLADNQTREGRQQNRRVEVKILVSRGLNKPVGESKPATTTSSESAAIRN